MFRLPELWKARPRAQSWAAVIRLAEACRKVSHPSSAPRSRCSAGSILTHTLREANFATRLPGEPAR